LLEQRPDDCRQYLGRQFEHLTTSVYAQNYHKAHFNYIMDSLLENPVSGLLLGMETHEFFRDIPYEEKLNFYKISKTLMPQTSLYYVQDPVISTPAGLVKPKMAMWVRRQEPDILEIALGKGEYVYHLKNKTEGGDVTMCSYACVHGGDIFYIDGRMLLGINALSGQGAVSEAEKVAKAAGTKDIVLFFTPDYFEPRARYATGNVMHLDTVMMPIDESTVLGNKSMLERTAVREQENPIINGYDWARKNYIGFVDVPDDEQQGIRGWGSNVLPLGNKKIISSAHLENTNMNLKRAGFDVCELESSTLTSGFGSFHCMTAYLK